MWICPRCGERCEEQFDACWKCSANRSGAPALPEKSKVKFEIFRGTFKSWELLFTEAAEFASALGAGRLISISHSEDDNDGVVTVWYWSDEKPAAPGGGQRAG